MSKPTTVERYERLQTAFLHARELPSTAQADYVASAEVDPDLRAELVELLRTDQDDGFDLLAHPLVDEPSATILTQWPSPSAPAMPESIGPYRLLQLIGEGGHGLVYLAEQRTPVRRQVALKIVKPGMDSRQILARFAAERQALAMMHHPSIANVLDAGQTADGQPFFVMELVRGLPIDQFCDDNRMPLAERLALFQQVCHAVYHAHQKGVIHRDLKPANILVTVASGQPLAKVIDFGIAKALDNPLSDRTLFTEFGQILGTLEYMSPEQAVMSQSGIDTRSDVYSLGVLLYRLLTGETPHSRDQLLQHGMWEIKNVLRDATPTSPSEKITQAMTNQRWVDRQLPANWQQAVRGDLDWIAMKALAKEPDRRYESAGAFAKDIERYLLGEAIEARPPSWTYRWSKAIRKYRWVAAAAAILFLALCVAVTGLAWGTWRSRISLRQMEQAVDELTINESQLAAALAEAEAERARADETSERLSNMLSQGLMKGAWELAMDGAASQAQRMLDTVPSSARRYEWQLISTIAPQMKKSILRRQEANTRVDAVDTLAVQATQQQMTLVSTSSQLEVWDLTRGQCVHRLRLAGGDFKALQLAADANVAFAGSDGQIVRISLEGLPSQENDEAPPPPLSSERRLVSAPLNHGAIRQLAVTAERIAAITGDDHLVLLDAATLEVLAEQLLPQTNNLVCWNPHPGSLFVAGADGQLLRFAGDTLDPLPTMRITAQPVARLAFVDDRLWAADVRGAIYEIDTQAGRSLPRLPAGENISDTTWLDDQGAWQVATDGSLYFCDLVEQTRHLIWRSTNALAGVWMKDDDGGILIAHANSELTLVEHDELSQLRRRALSSMDLADGRLLTKRGAFLTAHTDGSLQLRDLESGRLLLKTDEPLTDIIEIGVDANEDYVAAVSSDQRLLIARLPTLETRYLRPISWGVRGAAFSEDGKRVATAAAADNPRQLREGTIDLWSPQSGKPLLRLAGHTNWVYALQFIDADRKLVSLSEDGTAKLWDLERGDCLWTMEIPERGKARTMSVSRDGRRLVLGHSDGYLSAWDLESQRHRGTRSLCANAVTSVTALPGDPQRLLVTSHAEGSFWIVAADTLEPTLQLDPRLGMLQAVRISADGELLVLVGESGATRFWRLPTL